MKTIKTLVILFLVFTTVICAFADGLAPKPEIPNVDTMVDTITIVKDTIIEIVDKPVPLKEESSTSFVFILSLVLGLYEVFARFIPTVKDISILSLAMKFIAMILPNMKQGGGKHTL